MTNKFDLTSMQNLHRWTNTPYVLDTPMMFSDTSRLLDKIKPVLVRLREVQTIIDSTYTHQELLTIGSSNIQPLLCYDDPGKHRVHASFSNTGSYISYFFVHNIIDLDLSPIINEICSIINIPLERIKYLDSVTDNHKNYHKFPIGIDFIHLKPYSNPPYHVHTTGIWLNDNANVIMPISGNITFTMTTPPDDQIHEEYYTQITGLLAFNCKKLHSGSTNTDDTFMLFTKPPIGLLEIVDANPHIPQHNMIKLDT